MLLACTLDPIIKSVKFGIGRDVRLLSLTSSLSISIIFILILTLLLQVFRIFFESLTTTITQIEIYLSDNPCNRDITFKLKELAEFIDTLRAVREGKQVVKRKGRSKKKGADDEAAAAQAASEITSTYNKLVAENEAAVYVQSLGMSMDMLDKRLSEAIGCMRALPLSAHLRSDERAFVRYLTVGGLYWNERSQYKSRDYAQIGIASIIESLIVVTYREQLLKSCQGAAVMRKRLAAYFLEISKPAAVRDDQGVAPQSALRMAGMRRSQVKREWYFADLIVVDESAEDSTEYNSATLLSKLKITQEREKRRLSDPIVKLAETWRKNPFIACSEQGVAPGTIETSLYYMMEEVLGVSSFPFPSLPFPSFPLVCALAPKCAQYTIDNAILRVCK